MVVGISHGFSGGISHCTAGAGCLWGFRSLSVVGMGKWKGTQTSGICKSRNWGMKAGDIGRGSVLTIGFFRGRSCWVLCRAGHWESLLPSLCGQCWWPLLFFLVPSLSVSASTISVWSETKAGPSCRIPKKLRSRSLTSASFSLLLFVDSCVMVGLCGGDRGRDLLLHHLGDMSLF